MGMFDKDKKTKDEEVVEDVEEETTEEEEETVDYTLTICRVGDVDVEYVGDKEIVLKWYESVKKALMDETKKVVWCELEGNNKYYPTLIKIQGIIKVEMSSEED